MKTDLSKLTKAEKLALIDAIDEKRRRELDARASYVPNAGQLEVHRSKAMLRAVFAGNGGGKTALGVNEALWACSGHNQVTGERTPVPAKIIVVLDKPEKVADVWLPEIKKWAPLKTEQLHKRGKPYITAITFDNGSELQFMFHDQDPMSFESIELDFAIFDEPPPRAVYVSLRRGGRKKGRKPKFLIIGTPIAAAWMRKEIYEPWARGESPDVECFRYGTKVNEANLAEGYIADFSSVLSEKEKRIRLEGEFFDLEGLALAHLFSREKHVIAPPKWPAPWPVVCIIDPHPSKNHIAVLLGITSSGSFKILKEISSRNAARKFAGELKDFYKGYRVVDIVCDSLGNSESTGGDGRLSFIQVLREEGIRVRATTYDEKQDEAWIAMIQNVLLIPSEPNNFGELLPRLQIVKTCKGCIADVETVEWAKIKNIDDHKPKLDIARKDYLACIKYGLATQPRFQRGTEKVIRRTPAGGLMGQEKWRTKRA